MTNTKKTAHSSYSSADEDKNSLLVLTFFGGLVAIALVALILVEVANHQGDATPYTDNASMSAMPSVPAANSNNTNANVDATTSQSSTAGNGDNNSPATANPPANLAPSAGSNASNGSAGNDNTAGTAQ